MTLSTTAFAQGTQAARPAAAPGNLSFFYYETDTGLFYQSNGTDWVLVAPGTLAITPIGLTGATAPVRWVGGTASGAPASGTFAVGDFVIDQTGSLWICTAAGSRAALSSLSCLICASRTAVLSTSRMSRGDSCSSTALFVHLARNFQASAASAVIVTLPPTAI